MTWNPFRHKESRLHPMTYRFDVERPILIRTARHCFRLKRSDVTELVAAGTYVSIHTIDGDRINVNCGERETAEGLLSYLAGIVFDKLDPSIYIIEDIRPPFARLQTKAEPTPT